MNLLAGVAYDPGTAATASTASLLAMTALDTTNLRLSFTIPSHGMVKVRLRGTVHGGTTHPTIMLGVLDGSTVRMRVAPGGFAGGHTAAIAATTQIAAEAWALITGLTPGAATWDAAYGVEVVGASTALKWGGPNNTTTNDAFGAFCFEVWDPQPQTTTGQLSVDANGRVDVIKVAGTTQTAGDIIGDTNDIQGRLPAALVSGRIDASVGAMAANVLTAAAIAADAITDAKVASDVTIASVTGAVGSVTANVNADVKKINGVTIIGDGSGTPFNV